MESHPYTTPKTQTVTMASATAWCEPELVSTPRTKSPIDSVAFTDSTASRDTTSHLTTLKSNTIPCTCGCISQSTSTSSMSTSLLSTRSPSISDCSSDCHSNCSCEAAYTTRSPAAMSVASPWQCAATSKQLTFTTQSLSLKHQPEHSPTHLSLKPTKICASIQAREVESKVTASSASKSVSAFAKVTSDVPISHLPSEVLIHIFSFLSRTDKLSCAQVCRQWNYLAADASLWESIVIQAVDLTHDAAMCMLSRQPRVLSLAQCYVSPNTMGEETIPFCVKASCWPLLSLNLRDASISNDLFLAIIRNAPNLLEIDIGNTTLSDECTSLIGQYCPNLQSFGASMCTGITDVTFTNLAMHCPSLHTLSLGWLSPPLPPQTLRRVVESCKQLKHIDLSGSQRILTDAAIHHLARRLEQLETLDVSDCYGLTDESIRALVRHASALRHLSLSRCHHITVAAMKQVAKIKTLQAVDLFGCYRNVYPHIQAVCGHLRINSSLESPVKAISAPQQ
eukprot:m.39814 g.39814  ORF g.39814 m.39814 type:complete len:509 (+) comp10362_c0_seq1:662-2188(+)